MSYWKTKVLPKFKKFFDKGKTKGAADVCKSFDKSKESLEKEIGEKPDLQLKVVEIYRSSTFTAQKLFKEPSEIAVKDNPGEAQSVLQELAKAGFPGAQLLSDAGIKYGPALLPGPIVFLLEKTSTFVVEEPLSEPVKEETPREGDIVQASTEPPKDETPTDSGVEKAPDAEDAKESEVPLTEAPPPPEPPLQSEKIDEPVPEVAAPPAEKADP